MSAATPETPDDLLIEALKAIQQDPVTARAAHYAEDALDDMGANQ